MCVQPLISVICDKNKLTAKGCIGSPDLVIEVVSPSSRKMDYSTKNTLYSNADVREYWIVDPEKERTTIYYDEEDAAPTIIPFSQPLISGIYPGLTIHILELLQ
ncbi:MAG: Uma2 family endonuclease [Lachnospiraceae bacterium]|nr:Uma2 family endonuclease [Lachnospiraceae bacterium]